MINWIHVNMHTCFANSFLSDIPRGRGVDTSPLCSLTGSCMYAKFKTPTSKHFLEVPFLAYLVSHTHRKRCSEVTQSMELKYIFDV